MPLPTNQTQTPCDEIDIQTSPVKASDLARANFLKGSLGASSAALLEFYVLKRDLAYGSSYPNPGVRV